MTKSLASVIWDDLSLLANLQTADKKMAKELDVIMQYNAPQVEASMKINAPWNDQTGNARQGLGARPFVEGSNHGIVLFHSVAYGIWLEVRFNQRYAIILPTIESYGPQVMEQCKGLLGKVKFS
jgi:hypothetical protein